MPTPALLDVRTTGDFVAGHVPGSAHIPLAELPARVHELPPRDVPLTVFDDSPCRAAEAEELLADRGWTVTSTTTPPGDLDETGPARVRLWRANAHLAGVVRGLGPGAGRRALDVACGSGRDAVFLALQGWSVTAVDNLPDAVAMADALAARNGVPLRAVVRDVEAAGLPPLPEGPDAMRGQSPSPGPLREPPVGRCPLPLRGARVVTIPFDTESRHRDTPVPAGEPGAAGWDLIGVFHFLHRPLVPALLQAVRPGGSLVIETFTTAHRARYGKPRSDAHLLLPGEARGWVAGWDVRVDDEGEFTPGRITARLHAVKPATGGR